MPIFDHSFDDEKLEDLESSGGRKPETLRKRARFVAIFERYLQESQCRIQTLAELVQDKEFLEHVLCLFFGAYRVGVDAHLPMKNTVMNCRSHLKCEISRLTESRLDIQNPEMFHKFHVSKNIKFHFFVKFFDASNCTC